MNLHMLKLNSDKTEFIMFGMKQQLAKSDRIDINISATTIQTVESVHNLVYFHGLPHEEFPSHQQDKW